MAIVTGCLIIKYGNKSFIEFFNLLEAVLALNNPVLVITIINYNLKNNFITLLNLTQ